MYQSKKFTKFNELSCNLQICTVSFSCIIELSLCNYYLICNSIIIATSLIRLYNSNCQLTFGTTLYISYIVMIVTHYNFHVHVRTNKV